MDKSTSAIFDELLLIRQFQECEDCKVTNLATCKIRFSSAASPNKVMQYIGMYTSFRYAGNLIHRDEINLRGRLNILKYQVKLHKLQLIKSFKTILPFGHLQH